MPDHPEIPRPPRKVTEVKPSKIHSVLKKKLIPHFTARRPATDTAPRLPKGVGWGILGILVLFVAGFAISFFVAKHELSAAVASHTVALNQGIADLQNMDAAGAAAQFSTLNGDLSQAKGLLSTFGALFQGGNGAIASFADLSNQLGLLSQELTTLQGNAFTLFENGTSTNLAPQINALRDTVDALNTDTDQLSSAAAFLGNESPLSSNDYVSLKTQLEGAKTFLDAFAPWIASGTPHHVLIFLQNPSEIRPAGGFLGSYADITIASGTVQNIAVRDVADVDEGFTANIVPPKPLQLEVKRWRPADANWFFDFPTSASETISFFEQSSLYAASSTTFDGAIAISPQVVSDLLSVTGPITVGPSTGSTGSPQATFTADNFLVQIQKLVQNGQAQDATYPKQVLRDLTTAVFQNLASSTDAQKQTLLATALNWANEKDVMAYFKDPDFENFITSYGAGGDVYQLPQNFNGDYLAVVDANVNGGKSDLYVSSTVQWEDQINTDGTLDASVIINRKHNGNTSPYWWYQVTNQDYLQLFVPDGSTLTNENGGVNLKITPKINYVSNSYSTDPLVASIESTNQTLFDYPAVTSHEESGKQVFSTWAIIKSGATTALSFDYTHQLFVPPAPGVVYQFIFEKQAGTNRNYIFDIDAPIGYQFAETGLPTFHYESNDPPGRLIISLTLEKI